MQNKPTIKSPIPTTSGFPIHRESVFRIPSSVFSLLYSVFCAPPIPMILSAYKAALHLSRSLYLCREASTLVVKTLQIDYFLCKTNPISTEAKTNLTLYIKKVYENLIPPRTMKNEPKTNPKRTQFKPNPLMNKTNPTLFPTKVYDNKPPRRTRKNEPKTNPIQTQFLLPQSPHSSQLPTAEIKAFRVYPCLESCALRLTTISKFHQTISRIPLDFSPPFLAWESGWSKTA